MQITNFNQLLKGPSYQIVGVLFLTTFLMMQYLNTLYYILKGFP